MKITGKNTNAKHTFDLELNDEKLVQNSDIDYFVYATINVGTGTLKAYIRIPKSELETLLWKAIDSKLRA